MITDTDKILWRTDVPPEGREQTAEEKVLRILHFDHIGWEDLDTWCSPWTLVSHTKLKLSPSLQDVSDIIATRLNDDLADIVVDFMTAINIYDMTHNTNRTPVFGTLRIPRQMKKYFPYEFPPSRALGKRLRVGGPEWKNKITLTRNSVLLLRHGVMKNKNSMYALMAESQSHRHWLDIDDVDNACEYDVDGPPWGTARCKECEGNFVMNSLYALDRIRDQKWLRTQKITSEHYNCSRGLGPIEKRLIKGVLEGRIAAVRVLFDLWNEARGFGHDLINGDLEWEYETCLIE
nr:hypothetical protein [Sicyoidochytrium minutum DNA virus]